MGRTEDGVDQTDDPHRCAQRAYEPEAGGPTGAYLPGFTPDAMRMLSARTAGERAGLLLPHLAAGMRVLDVGCGPGSITAGLADAVAPGGVVIGVDVSVAQLLLAQRTTTAPTGAARWVAGSAAALPIQDGAMAAVFAHALFEHLTQPQAVLAEMGRVLRAGGLLAVCSSDWGAATIEPRTPSVATALRAYWWLRERAGTDPRAGSRLAERISAAGLTVRTTRELNRVDMDYAGLGTYLRDRLAAAAAQPEYVEHTDELATAARAADRWAGSGPGRFSQRWVEVLATAPYRTPG